MNAQGIFIVQATSLRHEWNLQPLWRSVNTILGCQQIPRFPLRAKFKACSAEERWILTDPLTASPPGLNEVNPCNRWVTSTKQIPPPAHNLPIHSASNRRAKIFRSSL
ncbi:hypothetical protein CIHG_02781 [Coccidioides immitis H538.4]|uniref:Uncharacterized protein n=3 Tax=Coccidioides immitis TaxID=5501 RepID=A0A0J8QHA4_COCIT|nr:hypothetical protein CIRG_07497 [Coccidioides immitis RMSCC 2394]KMU71724.1 hypothetical protein CISG_00033 [Coccidioides immitis RMSCC 3703]KMU84998.1 hypothetical protein CIHG_02781 [Coccidioides immitis H538.4]